VMAQSTRERREEENFHGNFFLSLGMEVVSQSSDFVTLLLAGILLQKSLVTYSTLSLDAGEDLGRLISG
jgi:hypothetical protein